MNLKLTPDRLHRRAVVYIRQSSPDQVLHHQESTCRQYGLVDQARTLGFQNVVVIEKDPDQRVQQALELVFRKMTELGSVRQVLIWFRQQNLRLPVSSGDGDESGGESPVAWKRPVYRNLWVMLTHPLYAGAYAFGR